MSRKLYEWKIREKTLQLGERTLVMGILNVTPDSFSDGGKYSDPDRAFARAMELEEEGADIIDIGAESMRPGSVRISEAEELRRLVPVLKRLQGRLTVALSVDTYKSGVAAKALELGADIINDPTGLTADPEISRAAAAVNAGLILNHMRGTPETWAKLPPLKDPMANLAMELDSAMHRAIRQGLERKRIVIDPGLGFGKRKEQNSEILARLDELASLELPIMVGPSRKHFLAREVALETEFASAAAIAAAVLYGAHIVRVHDVKAMKVVVDVADEIARARAARDAARQEASKQEGSRQGGRSERPSAGGPREARPPGSRPQEGNPRPQESRIEDRRDTRVAFRSEEDDLDKSRQPLRPPTSRSAAVKRPEEATPDLSMEDGGDLGSEASREREADTAREMDADAIVEVKAENVGFRVARPPASASSSKPIYSRPAASGSGGYKSGDYKSRDSRSRDSRSDDRRDSRPPLRDAGQRGDRPSRFPSRPPAYGSRDTRDSRSDGPRDSRGGPRQGSFGRRSESRSDRPSGPRSDRLSGPPRTGRSFSGPPRSDRPSGPRSDRPSGPPRGRSFSGPPRSERSDGPPRGKSFSGPPRSGRPSSGRSDRPSGPPRGKPFSPRRPGDGSGPSRRPPGRG